MKDLIVLVFHFKVSFFVCDSTGWDVQCGNSLSHFFRKNCYIVDLTNFFSVRDNFSFFHTAVKRTVWKSWNFSLTLFQQKFRESNGFTKQITKELIWRNIFSVRPNFSFFHTVKRLFLIFFVKSVTKVRNENDFFRETIFNFALAFFCENSVKTTFFSSIWRFFKFLLERYLCRFSNPVLELFQQRLMKGKTFTQDLCGWKHPFTQRKLS